MHDVNSTNQQEDHIRELYYVIHWTSYSEKHFNKIEQQLEQVQQNLRAMAEAKREDKLQEKVVSQTHDAHLNALYEFRQEKK